MLVRSSPEPSPRGSDAVSRSGRNDRRCPPRPWSRPGVFPLAAQSPKHRVDDGRSPPDEGGENGPAERLGEDGGIVEEEREELTVPPVGTVGDEEVKVGMPVEERTEGLDGGAEVAALAAEGDEESRPATRTVDTEEAVLEEAAIEEALDDLGDSTVEVAVGSPEPLVVDRGEAVVCPSPNRPPGT